LRKLSAAVICILFALLTITAPEAWSKEKKSAAPSKKEETATQPQSSAAQIPANEITQAAAKAGVVTCLSRVNQITNFVGANTQNGALLMLAPDKVDKKPFSIAMEVKNPANSSLSYVTTNFSPASDGSCSGSYESVNVWTNSCDEVATKVFAGFKSSGRPISQQIKVLENGPSTHVFFMPAGAGCIVIKREVLY
jgi:hypothetical protein